MAHARKEKKKREMEQAVKSKTVICYLYYYHYNYYSSIILDSSTRKRLFFTATTSPDIFMNICSIYEIIIYRTQVNVPDFFFKKMERILVFFGSSRVEIFVFG